MHFKSPRVKYNKLEPSKVIFLALVKFCRATELTVRSFSHFYAQKKCHEIGHVTEPYALISIK